MRKMKLQLDDLRVESFATAEATTHRGTVRGHDQILPEDEAGTDATCPPVNTCNQTYCGGYSCEWTKCPGDGCKAEEVEEGQGFGI
jgi:hypothetical protein